MASEAKDSEPAFTLTRSELRQLMREAATEALAQASKPPAEWVDIATAAKHCDVTGQTIRNWIALGAPASQVGRDFKVKLDEFDAWVQARRPERKLKRIK